MAKWKCPVFGCDVWVRAPDVRPVHAKAPNPFFQGKDPHCPTHGVDLDWFPDLVAPEPEKVARHPGYTLSGELKTSYSIKEQPDVRKQVSSVMGITDKGHKTHGSNFSSPQTLKQIIDNLFMPITGTQRDVAAEAIIEAYGYDPRTGLMAT